MSQGSADAKNVFIDYTDYFCSFCAQIEDATSNDSFKNDYIKSGKLRYEHRIVTLLKDKVPNTEQGAKAAFCAAVFILKRFKCRVCAHDQHVGVVGDATVALQYIIQHPANHR